MAIRDMWRYWIKPHAIGTAFNVNLRDKRFVDWYNPRMSELIPEKSENQNQVEAETAVSTPATTAQRIIPFIVMILVIILDQYSKRLVEANVPLYTSWAPIPAIKELFQITHTANTGAAFGLFPSGSLFFGVMAAIVSLVIIYFNHTLPGGQKLLRVALGFQLGGALGNMIDRLRIGHVTDFLDFGPWYIFNVADMAVVSGVIIIALLMLQEQREEREQEKERERATAVSPE